MLLSLHSFTQPVDKVKNTNDDAQGKKSDAVWGMVFSILIDSISERQSTIVTQTKELTVNTKIQNELNEENARIRYSVLPANAHTNTVEQVNDRNKEYSADRTNIQNKLITSQQNSREQNVSISADMSVLQQFISQQTGMISVLNIICKSILAIGK